MWQKPELSCPPPLPFLFSFPLPSPFSSPSPLPSPFSSCVRPLVSATVRVPAPSPPRPRSRSRLAFVLSQSPPFPYLRRPRPQSRPRLRSYPRPRPPSPFPSLLLVSWTWLAPRYNALAPTPGLVNGAMGCPQVLLPVSRDDGAYRRKVPAVKQKGNSRRRRDTSVPSARCWDLLKCISDLCSTRLMGSSLMRACTSEPALPQVAQR